jgi:hypothetical protein
MLFKLLYIQIIDNLSGNFKLQSNINFNAIHASDHLFYIIQCSLAIVDTLKHGQIFHYNESSLYRVVDYLRFLSYTLLKVMKNENYFLNEC